MVHKIGETDQYRGQTNETVQDRNQFGHLGHLDFFGKHKTDGTANGNAQKQDKIVVRDNTDNSGDKSHEHAEVCRKNCRALKSRDGSNRQGPG